MCKYLKATFIEFHLVYEDKAHCLIKNIDLKSLLACSIVASKQKNKIKGGVELTSGICFGAAVSNQGSFWNISLKKEFNSDPQHHQNDRRKY